MRTVLVTGGGGFLGSAVVDQLLARGDRVRVLARGSYPHLAAQGVELFTGSITDLPLVRRAGQGCEVVFHVAAKASDWGKYSDFFRTNVVGTATIIRACRDVEVPALVYTSSPSVVTDASLRQAVRHRVGLAGVDESAPYSTHYTAAYPETKARAERLVLHASGDQLRTVALRPHLIWGPGDTQLIPRILARARAGHLRLVGPGENLVDTTYIDDAAAAHLLAADRLLGDPHPTCDGKPYFITSGDPQPLKVLVNSIVNAAELPPVTDSVPLPVAYAAGAVLEGAWRLLRRHDEPLMTRFTAHQLASTHWFDISAARRDLGYLPQVSVTEGMNRLRKWLACSPVG